VVVVPYTSAMRRITGRQYLSTILIQAENADQIPMVQQGVTDLLRQRRSGRDPDFTVRNQLEIAQAATATSKTMTVLLGAIAGVSLIVGGIGIMNIMLVSVTERTREIGIRMAVGAHGRDILMQFLIEAVTLSALSGLLGIGVGFGASKIISNVAGWATQIPMASVVLAFGVSALIGVGFGLYPAWKAAALDPIDALRYE
jgi:putative ABC transport system permease protein